MTTKTVIKQGMFKTFMVDYMSEQDGERYNGKFTVKKLSLRDSGQLGVLKAQKNGGMHYDSETPGYGIDYATSGLNHMIAHLELSVKEAPPWWNLDQITDMSLLSLVFKEVLDFEQSFLARNPALREKQESGPVGEGSSAAVVQTTNTAGVPSQVVGEKVQSSLEP